MKKRFLIFLGIFLFMIIPKNVYAEQILPYNVKLNDKVYVDYSTSTSNYVSANVTSSNSFILNLFVTSQDNNQLAYDQSFRKYPYILVFFQSSNSLDEMVINKNGSCSSSCFNLWGTSLRSLGKNPLTNNNNYVLILRAQKYTSDCGVGNGQCFYTIADGFTFGTKSSSSRNFQFVGVVLSDTDEIANVDDINVVINNASQNTQNIINNALQNTQQIIDNQNSNAQATQEAIQDIQDTITSDEIPTGNNDTANGWASKNASTNAVSDMVLMPITLLRAFVNGFNATCTPYNLGSLYGTDLQLPCIKVSDYLGTTLWGVIDVLFSGFMIYAMGKKFVKVFNDFTNLRDNQIDELYGGGK